MLYTQKLLTKSLLHSYNEFLYVFQSFTMFRKGIKLQFGFGLELVSIYIRRMSASVQSKLD
jgi:hypothetical protein